MPVLTSSRNPVFSRRKATMHMKELFLALSVSAFAESALGQSYSVDWFSIGGGGGTIAGPSYLLDASIGHHDASVAMSGGSFSLTGGFWSIVTVQTPGAPLLKIFLTATNTAVISWPSPSTAFTLQQRADMNDATWVMPPEAVSNNDT